MDATIGEDVTVFCFVCHQGIEVPIDGDLADIGGVRAHLRSHYGPDAFVDFQVADMLAHALGFGPAVSAGDYLTVSARGGVQHFGASGVVGAGNLHQPNSSSSAPWTIGHTTYF